MAGEEELNGEYLQLRKDLMKVPKQFYLNKEPMDGEHSNKVGDYFKYASGEEGGLALKQQLSSSKKGGKLGGSPVRAPATVEGGHPLVPKLNLP